MLIFVGIRKKNRQISIKNGPFVRALAVEALKIKLHL